jgi:hypothetical protein
MAFFGLGIFEATSLQRSKKSPLEAQELSNGVFHNTPKLNNILLG